MPATSRHRGRHPADEQLFAAEALPTLREATSDLSWLFGRGYSQVSALKLVGDRYELRKRQRKAVLRSACSDAARSARARRRVGADALAGRELWLDGFNCVITIEAAISRGVILRGRDRAHRDMSSVHGSYRRVDETEGAIRHIAELLAECRVSAAHWFLDRPVSNSGRLATMLREAAPAGMDWQVELVFSPDRALCEDGDRVTATSDAWVLDHCGDWFDVPGAVIERRLADPWLLDLASVDEREASR